MRARVPFAAAALALLAACTRPAPLAPGPRVAVSASEVRLTAPGRGLPVDPAAITVRNAGSGTLQSPQVTVRCAGEIAWLTATVSGSAAPFRIALQADDRGLASGAHFASVTVEAPGAVNPPVTVGVWLDEPLPVLVLETSSLRFDVAADGTTSSQTVKVRNDGGGQLGACRGQGQWTWVETAAGAPDELLVGLSPPAAPPWPLPAGVYQEVVYVWCEGSPTDLEPLDIVFQLPPARLTVDPASLGLGAEQRNPQPVLGFQVFNVGASAPGPWVLEVRYADGEPSGWLSAWVQWDWAERGATVNVQAVAQAIDALAPGTYHATAVVGAEGAVGSPLEVPVQVDVWAPALAVGATTVTFEAPDRGDPPAQHVALRDTFGGQLPQPQVTVSYLDGAGWLDPHLAPTPDGQLSLELQAHVADLGLGYHRADVTIAAPGATGSPATIAVTVHRSRWHLVEGAAGSRDDTATLLTDGRVLLVGQQGAGVIGAAADSWTPQSTGWRYQHSATLLADGRVLLYGGETAGPLWEIWDPATGGGPSAGSGSTVSDRASHTATLLPSGKVLLAGGMITVGAAQTSTVLTETFDPATLTVGDPAYLHDMHVGGAAARLPDGRVLLAGGYTTRAEIYDPATGTWAFTGNMNVPRAHFALAVLQDGRVLAAGGDDAWTPVASAEIWDPTSGTWTPTGDLSLARSFTGPGALLPDGRVLVAGGAFQLLPDVAARVAEIFDPATGTWSPTDPLLHAMAHHAVVALPGVGVLAAGDADCEVWREGTP